MTTPTSTPTPEELDSGCGCIETFGALIKNRQNRLVDEFLDALPEEASPVIRLTFMVFGKAIVSVVDKTVADVITDIKASQAEAAK